MINTSITRRAFLKSSLAAGLIIAVSVGPFGYELPNASGKKKGEIAEFSPNAWFTVTA